MSAPAMFTFGAGYDEGGDTTMRAELLHQGVIFTLGVVVAMSASDVAKRATTSGVAIFRMLANG